jgi:hypothetical protein
MFQFKIQNSKFKIASLAALFFAASGAARADLEWITGGVPGSASGADTSTVVQDGPSGGPVLGPAGEPDILMGHMTTCTRIVGQYPADSVNFFYPKRHSQVSYFAYFLSKPSSRIHTAVVECFSPTGMRIARYEREYKVSFVDNLLTIKEETYQWFLLDLSLGIEKILPEYGQTALPKILGLYSLHLSVDGRPIGVTFFYIKEEEPQTPSSASTPVPSKPLPALPMNTPVSTAPLRRNP